MSAQSNGRPKLKRYLGQAAARFAGATGGRAAIGNPAEAADVLAGRSGTTVVPVAARTVTS